METTFGSRVKELRMEKNMRQEDLAQEFGVTKGTVSKWERDVMKPSFEVMDQLSVYFGVSFGYMIGSDEEREDYIPTNEELAGWALSDEDMYLTDVVKRFLQLSEGNKKIITAAITAAYKVDQENGELYSADDRKVMIKHRYSR